MSALRARSSVSERMPVSRQTAISSAAQAYTVSGRMSDSRPAQSAAMAALSAALTPVVREQNSRASQAVIFWSGAKVSAVIPFTTPLPARYSTSARAQWPVRPEKAAPADTVSRETDSSAASARDRILLPFIACTSLGWFP